MVVTAGLNASAVLDAKGTMHSRRTFIGRAAAAVAAIVVGPKVVAEPVVQYAPVPGLPKLGDPHPAHVIGIEEWNAKYADCRLMLDGRDVTCESFACCPSEGWADCYRVAARSDSGAAHRFVMEDGSLAHYRRHGKVEIVRKVRSVTNSTVLRAGRWVPDEGRVVTIVLDA